MSTADPRAIHHYWFGDSDDWLQVIERNNARWFEHGARLDDEIREGFGDAVEQARSGALDHWRHKAGEILALVLLLDQFPRHIFRGTANAFASDEQALDVCRSGIEQGLDEQLCAVEQSFFYLPLQHAESMQDQDLSVRMLRLRAAQAPEELHAFLANTLRYGELHRDIVARFGRFPHRNPALGRQNTEQEQVYLDGGGQRFGQ